MHCRFAKSAGLLCALLFCAMIALPGCESTPGNGPGRDDGDDDNLGTLANPKITLPEPGLGVPLKGFIEWVPEEEARRAPVLDVYTLGAEKTTLKLGKSKRPKIIFFWDPHNHYCRAAALYMQQLHNQYLRRRKPFDVVGIVIKQKDYGRVKS